MVLVQDVYKNRHNMILKFGEARIHHVHVQGKRIHPPARHCTGLDNAVIINNKDLQSNLISAHSNERITAVHIWWSHGGCQKELVIVNVYLRPREDLEPDLQLLGRLLHDPQWRTLPIIISGDWNARHEAWD